MLLLLLLTVTLWPNTAAPAGVFKSAHLQRYEQRREEMLQQAAAAEMPDGGKVRPQLGHHGAGAAGKQLARMGHVRKL